MRVAIEGISKRYDDGRRGVAVEALHDVSLTIEDGEFITVLGPSGCGKSTLLHITAGLLPPSSGRVVFHGVPPGRPLTAVVFQDHALFPWRTVRDNVGFGLEIRGITGSERRQRVERAMAQVGLSAAGDRYPHQLSGGMGQRAAIARALIVEPALLVMDEPFSALDAQSRMLLTLELLGLWERTRHAVLYVTHQIQEAVLLADRVVIMGRRPGRILAIRPVSLPRPRGEHTYREPDFLGLVEECWQLVRADARTALDHAAGLTPGSDAG